MFNWLFKSRWKTESSRVVIVEMRSVLFNQSWDEEVVLEHQVNESGSERYFLVYLCGRKEKVDPAIVSAILDK